jgi:hypothetical protein
MAEFMYDVAVVRSNSSAPPLLTPGHKKPFTPLGRALWLIESEVAISSFAVAADLSKLVLGDSDHKLFVTKRRRNVMQFNSFLFDASRACRGHLFVAYIASYAKIGFSTQWHLECGKIDYSLWYRAPQTFEEVAA